MNFDQRGFYYGNEWMSWSQMQTNAKYIYRILSFDTWNQPITGNRQHPAWTINAIAGFLGNLQTESNINPAIYESLEVNPSKGYGLVQWTPGSTYLNWAAARALPNWDIGPQLARLYWEEEQPDMDHGREWSVETRAAFLGPYQPFNLPREIDFWTDDTHDAGWLAAAWCLNYERPGHNPEDHWQSAQARESQGMYWYNFLRSLPPPRPIGNPLVWWVWKMRDLIQQKGRDYGW